MTLLKITAKQGITHQAVQYDGRSTSAAALQNWINNDEYVKPKIATNDVRERKLILDRRRVPILYGDYLIRITKGEFTIVSGKAFDYLFNVTV